MQTKAIEIVIEPNRSWFRFPWREILEYRDLLLIMVQRDFSARYKQTVLDPAWFIIQPLMTTLVYVAVFNRVAKIPTDTLPPTLFYLCGQLAWAYFSGSFGSTSGTFTGNAGLLGKVYFPRLILPLSKLLSGLFTLGLQAGTFVAFWIYFKFFSEAGAAIHLRAWAVLLPLVVVQCGAIGMGAGLWMAALTAKYRDLSYVTGFLIQLWMFATPVVYPLSLVPEKWRWAAAINPMTAPVEALRFMLLGQGTLTLPLLATSAAITMVLLVTGVLLFNRTERTFIDTV